MRVLLLANAAASSVTARTRVLIQTLLNDRYDVQLALTKQRGHAAQLAREAAANGCDAVVVLGGDGTLNEAANGLAGTRCALAALPGGSTNVFARTIGTDDDCLTATAAICDALDEDRIELIGLGEANVVEANVVEDNVAETSFDSPAAAAAQPGRFFLFHCGIGFDAAVVSRVERWPKLKRYMAHPLYIAAATATWMSGSHRNTIMTVTHEGAEAEDSTYTVVLNTDPYTYVGSRPLSLAPAANLQNGLSVFSLRTASAKSILGGLLFALRSDDDLDRLNSADLHRRDDLAEVVVKAGGGAQKQPPTSKAKRPILDYQIDGEYLGKTTCVRFKHHPRILAMVLP